ncbi:Signal transduction response regulator, receiver region domain protein, partial [Candidatus Magnetobacterium bavaricum]
GLELFKIQSPDVVVTDIRMPNMDGIQMAKHIKEIRRR